jgi:monoamine oxidase
MSGIPDSEVDYAIVGAGLAGIRRHGYMEGALRSGRRAAEEMLQADPIIRS